MFEFFLGLGSNQGDRLENLKNAINLLGKLGHIDSCSSVYETAPKYETNQPQFLNLVCSLHSSLTATDLFRQIKNIEQELGRIATYRNGPRVIDIDLLFSDSEKIESSELILPHPRIAERAFVLVPLAEIGARKQIESAGQVSDLLGKLPVEDLNEVRVFSNSPLCFNNKIICLKSGQKLDFSSDTLLMGIINATPDSFSKDGIIVGNENPVNKAIAIAREMIEAGANILDIGGESSRPGSSMINAEEEARRLIPVVKALRKEFSIPLSVDTWRSKVAELALNAGAEIINDIWGLQGDAAMASVVKKHEATVIIMHNSSNPGKISADTKLGASYQASDPEADIIEIVCSGLRSSLQIANKAGINNSNIIIDPGFGFGKSLGQNLALLNNLDKLKNLGFPILSATSRKSFIGQVLNSEVEQRLEGSLASAVIAVMKGANIIRAHDVKATRQCLRLIDSLRPHPEVSTSL